ncbi:hypothetical protein ACFYY3_31910 [Streptomyces sp. NPDC001812]|uniref:hypothetical protein n=1 Tax=unclassified Streptomyces TaxID=2593676 RepID=UPI00369A6958
MTCGPEDHGRTRETPDGDRRTYHLSPPAHPPTGLRTAEHGPAEHGPAEHGPGEHLLTRVRLGRYRTRAGELLTAGVFSDRGRRLSPQSAECLVGVGHGLGVNVVGGSTVGDLLPVGPGEHPLDRECLGGQQACLDAFTEGARQWAADHATAFTEGSERP